METITQKQQLENLKLDLQRIQKSAYQAAVDANQDNLDDIAFEVRTSKNNYESGPSITYRNYFKMLNDIAKSSSALGIKKEDTILTLMPNLLEARALIYGHNIIGSTVFPTALMAPNNMVAKFINDNEIKNIFILSDIYEKYQNALNEKSLEHIICVGENIPKHKKIIPWTEYYQLKDNVASNIEPYYEKDKTAFLIGTSGTTGVAKCTCITNENLNAGALAYVDGNLMPGKTFMDILFPSITYGLIMGHVQLLDHKKTYIIPEVLLENTVKALCAIKPDIFAGGPVHQINIINSDEFKAGKIPPRKIYLSGGASLPKTVEETANNVQAGYKENGTINENLLVRQGYAMTETTGTGTMNPIGDYALGSIGKPIPYIEVKICNPETNQELGPNEPGEVYISGPTVAKGYYKNPEETKKAFQLHDDGKIWVHTNDIAYKDQDGHFFHVDRSKNIFMRIGTNVFPHIIAEFLNTLPYVKDSHVLGIEHPKYQTVPIAFIELQDNLPLSLEEILTNIKNECVANLEELSVPLDYIFVSHLPRNLGGKIDNNILKSALNIDYSKNPEGIQMVRELKLK